MANHLHIIVILIYRTQFRTQHSLSDGVKYKREIFASAPDQVIVVKLSSKQAKTTKYKSERQKVFYVIVMK